jgi:hypothetical protein
MLMALAVGAASAHAAPSLHCEAAPLRATVAGTQSVEPITQGRDAPCATGEAVPSLPANPLLSASVLTAKTTFDAAAPAGTATGGVASLAVVPTPELLNAALAPVNQAIDALPLQTVALPTPLSTLLSGLPLLGPTLSSVKLDVRAALHALVPTTAPSLLSADLLEARAGVTCAAGVPALAGSSSIVGVKVLGQDLGVDSAVDQVLPLLDGQSISLGQLDLTKLTVYDPTGAIKITGSLLNDVLAQLALVPTALTIPLPPSELLSVKLTPNEQTRDGTTLTQRALHASIALAGQPVLDAVLGEAKVGADDGACPKPVAPAAPATTTKAPAKTSAAAGQSVADQILACSDRKLVLVDVLKQGGRVKLLGAANRKYVGRKVAIRLRRGNRIVAHATVRKDGSFQTTAPMPPRAVMASHTKANTLRYRAEIGKELSLPLKLQRRLIVSSLTSKAGKVTIAGRVVGPLTTPVSTIRLVRRISCHKVVLVKRFKPNADGTFRVTVKAPKGQAAAVYRLASYVREKPSNPRKYPTFTLPRGVALNTR